MSIGPVRRGGQFDEFAPLRDRHALGVLHQQPAQTAAASTPTDDQGGDPHHRLRILQHPAPVRGKKSNNRAVRLGKQDRIRPGCGKLPDLLCRQRNGDRVTEFAQQSADGGGVFRRTWPDLDDYTPPIPKSSPTRQAAFSPWPVNTTTVV